ncbi:MAG: hypothetical protein GX890_03470 [Firmicutes bacterium]|nr:hypothetical protein [Bacillota bacterium]HPU01314.1 hypothetical protein [Bacillota bacterium]
MISSRMMERDAAGKILALLAALIVFGALVLGNRLFALGVALAAFVAWLGYRWQMKTLDSQGGAPPQKAVARVMAVALAKMFLNLILLGFSALGGVPLLFGVLTGLLLQMATHMGQAFYLAVKKGGQLG